MHGVIRAAIFLIFLGGQAAQAARAQWIRCKSTRSHETIDVLIMPGEGGRFSATTPGGKWIRVTDSRSSFPILRGPVSGVFKESRGMVELLADQSWDQVSLSVSRSLIGEERESFRAGYRDFTGATETVACRSQFRNVK